MTNGAAGNGPGPRDKVPPSVSSPTSNNPSPGHEQENGSENNAPLRRCIQINNPLGLHFRIAERFSRAAQGYNCTVRVCHGERQADGKSPSALIMLVVLPGAEVVLEVEGTDAVNALDPLAAILSAVGGEDYTI